MLVLHTGKESKLNSILLVEKEMHCYPVTMETDKDIKLLLLTIKCSAFDLLYTLKRV